MLWEYVKAHKDDHERALSAARAERDAAVSQATQEAALERDASLRKAEARLKSDKEAALQALAEAPREVVIGNGPERVRAISGRRVRWDGPDWRFGRSFDPAVSGPLSGRCSAISIVGATDFHAAIFF